MNKKIILFDIDGTLIDCIHGQKRMTTPTKQALLALKEAGHYIMIASGRPFCYLPKEFRDFPFDGYILDDGAYILFSDQELAVHPIHHTQLVPIIQQVLQKNLTFVGYGKKNAFVMNDDGKFVKYAQNFLLDNSFVKNIKYLDEIQEDLFKIHIHFHDEKDYLEFVLDSQNFFCADDKNFYLKEIYGTTYTKATALNEVLATLDISREKSYFLVMD